MTHAPAPSMQPIARALVITDDEKAIEILTAALGQLAVAAELCPDAAQAHAVLATKKVEAMVVDLRMGESALKAMQDVRVSSSNNRIVIMAIADSVASRSSALQSGASFVFEPPLSELSVDPTLRAAYGLIVRERRRYFRAAVECPVYVRRMQGREQCCNSLNVSEGGISIFVEAPLTVGDELQVHFTLPRPTTMVQSTVSVRWRDSIGRTGLQFVSLLQDREGLAALQTWLGTRLEESFPAAVLSKFQKRD